jgi:poly(hydroxyalkanoate) granule-associated protein
MAVITTHRLIDNWLTQGVIGSVQQVWLAGVGACMTIETEGKKLFGALVQSGKVGTVQASQQAEEVVEGLQERLETLREDGFNYINKLDKAFQKSATQGLRRLGIPRHEDIQHLARRIEAVQQSIDELIRFDQTKRTAAGKPGREIERLG